ncbi:hypothetical protein KSP40_PGU015957 [Platanthera guangdongensis]|uniref:Uncharacterized protein n=1 Tax=Platanthera guangdongensis TaxID=2320717 RepID=A0ABR2N5C0_9ASPA
MRVGMIHMENSEWTDWYSNVLVKRNALENTYNWACGRPTSVHDRVKDSDDEEFRDRDYDVAVLASNLSQAFRFNIHGIEDIEEALGSPERDKEDVYFDKESAEVLISSLQLGDDQDSSSLFTNSNWFALEDDRVKDHSTGPVASSSADSPDNDEVIVRVSEEHNNNPSSVQISNSGSDSLDSGSSFHESSCVNVPVKEPKNSSPPSETEKPPEWIEWREIAESGDLHDLESINISPNPFDNQSPESNDVAQSTNHSESPKTATSILNSASEDSDSQVKPDPDESEQK